MIQRIQSVYMLLAAIAMGLMFFFPFAQFIGGVDSYSLRMFGVYDSSEPAVRIVPITQMAILALASTALSFINIFLYKRRLLQIRVCFVSGVFMLGTALFVGYYIYRAYSSIVGFETHALSMSMIDVMPIVALIFTWLAKRGVIKDEALVRSLDRLR